MVKNKTTTATVETTEEKKILSVHDVEWTDYVLSLLTEDEFFNGNPTTDGLRRIFEKALEVFLIGNETTIIQVPTKENENRASAQVTLTFVPKAAMHMSDKPIFKVVGSSDAYWGNTDKLYRNHLIAVAETKAEGRALRKALKLRKTITADEAPVDVAEDNSITSTQIGFLSHKCSSLDINVKKLLDSMGLDSDNIAKVPYSDAQQIPGVLSKYQQDLGTIPESIKGYDPNWREV